jgi:hypothetical protein
MNFWCLNNFLEFKSDNKIHKMERTAQYRAEIWPMAVALTDRWPAQLGPTVAQMVGTGTCQPGARGGCGTRSPHVLAARWHDCRLDTGRCGAATAMDRAVGDPQERTGQDLGGERSSRRAVHGEAMKRRSCGGFRLWPWWRWHAYSDPAQARCKGGKEGALRGAVGGGMRRGGETQGRWRPALFLGAW